MCKLEGLSGFMLLIIAVECVFAGFLLLPASCVIAPARASRSSRFIDKPQRDLIRAFMFSADN